MNKDKLELLEVRPKERGFYFVTLFQFKKGKPAYIQDWLEYDGELWDYVGEYSGSCYVCFIHTKY